MCCSQKKLIPHVCFAPPPVVLICTFFFYRRRLATKSLGKGSVHISEEDEETRTMNSLIYDMKGKQLGRNSIVGKT